MAFISVTRLRLRSPWRLPRFFWHALRSRIQATKAPGNLSVDVLNDTHFAFWTKSAWKDESSMRAYMMSGAHRQAMPVMQDIVDEAATAHWEQETQELPTWPEAYKRLLEHGRFTKLKHPSAHHSAGTIPPPVG